MLNLPSSVRVFAARERVDFRNGFDGLCAIVREQFREDPLSGHLFLFFNRRRDRIKILVWDQNGFWLLYKRLEQGTFERIAGDGEKVEIDRARLAMLLDGIETKSSRIRTHFVRAVRIASRDHDERARTSP
jgi:transposase